MRILIATDAAAPQINGVVRVFETTAAHLKADGHVVEVIGPDRFATTFPAPGYPEVRLAQTLGRALPDMIDAFRPDAIHIPVEGPIGLAARHYCRKRRLPFTTSFHTRFGDYFSLRLGFGTGPAYAAQRWFHNAGQGFMVQTATLERQLAARGFRNIRPWGRAVDTDAFRPHREDPAFDVDFLNLPRPIFLYVGRVSQEKNLPAFFALDLPGSKVVVGDGPAAAALAKEFPDVHFLGYRHGEDLARHFSAADVFVFPSRFETFGLVVLESLACGTPVAAFPVQGPADIIGTTPHGVLSEDLRAAALAALSIDRTGCREFAESFSWAECTRQFAANLVPIPASAWTG
jgi:glycosyltransferase involved in cell wall biosynthesis